MSNVHISEFQKIKASLLELDLGPAYFVTCDVDGNFTITAYAEFATSVETVTLGSYTIVPADNNKVKKFTNNTATVTVTVDLDSLTNIGDKVDLDHWGTGYLLVSAGTATLRVNPKRYLYSDGQYSRITVQKMSSTEYRVFGELDIV